LKEWATYRPDYLGLSLVNLMSSIQRGFGANADYSPCNLLPPEELLKSESVILLLIDGLGYQYLIQNGQNSYLFKHNKGFLTSVFPSTTAAAISTIYTGLAPQNHGVLAWFMYLRTLGTVVTTLPMYIRYNKTSLLTREISPEKIFSVPSIFQNLPITSYMILPKELENSAYNRVFTAKANSLYYRTIEEFLAYPVNLVKNVSKRKLIIGYWPKIDECAHKTGMSSPETLSEFCNIDQQIASFIDRINTLGKNVTIIVTADHGLIDTTPERTVFLEQHPQLADCLALPCCGEPRTVFCYVRPRKVEQFENYVKNDLADIADLHPTDSLIAENYFGLGNFHPEFLSRVGDYHLFMKENYTFKDLLLGEKRQILIGNHGGTSIEEMQIPLILMPPDR
jgi:hypothetical protein